MQVGDWIIIGPSRPWYAAVYWWVKRWLGFRDPKVMQIVAVNSDTVITVDRADRIDGHPMYYLSRKED